MREKIIQEVSEIIQNITGKTVPKEYYESNLFSNKIGVKPFELVYIFFELENKFKIAFLPQEIIEGKFTSISRISELVYAKLDYD